MALRIQILKEATTSCSSPSSFCLRTCYKLRDGNELYLLIASGMGISVSLVLGSSWFKRIGIGAVINYPAKCLCINGHPDIYKFDLSFHKPWDVKPAISGGELSSHQAAFKSLTLMGHVKQVVQVFDPKRPYLTYYSKLIDQLQACIYTMIPAFIPLDEPRGNAVQPNGIKDDAGGQPGLDESGPQATYGRQQ